MAQPLEGESERGAALGTRITLSADGNTALLSSPSGIDADNVWVFERVGTTWQQQGPRLALPGRPGGFGWSSALSADGNTALIGGAQTMNAFVFTRSNGEWHYEAEMPVGGLYCGFSVALSADGRTAALGCPGDLGGDGAVLIFVRTPNGWELQRQIASADGDEVSHEAQFGRAVALSADGNTLLATAPLDDKRTGDAWIFTRSGTTWTRQTERLIPNGAGPGDAVGESAALSADGATAVIGAEGANEDVGAAWIYAKSGASWTQQSDRLVPPASDGIAQFGFSVALSADGGKAVIGAPSSSHERGAAWTYERSGTSWNESSEELNSEAEMYDLFGSGVSISGDGRTIVAGEPGWNEHAGRALAYTVNTPSPVIKTVSPKKGPAAGGTTITISGSGFYDPNNVRFGSLPAESFTATSASTITAVAPPGTTGAVVISVTTPWGVATRSTAFKYERPTLTALYPAVGPRAGGTQVVIHGTGFAIGTGTGVQFGKSPSSTVNCESTSECTAVAPAAAKAGEVDVVVQVGRTKSKKSSADHYRFE